MTVQVPFSFQVGDARFDSGEYVVTRVSPSLIAVRDANTGQVMQTLGTRASNVSNSATKLVFHRYGDRYFLSEIWSEGVGGYDLPRSHAEIEYARTRQSSESMAVIGQN